MFIIIKFISYAIAFDFLTELRKRSKSVDPSTPIKHSPNKSFQVPSEENDNQKLNITVGDAQMKPPLPPTVGTPKNSRPMLNAPFQPPLPRPILPRERSNIERFMEWIIGDGPQNRYALVCKKCYSHNGMALKEEFEYITFRCCYCFQMNDARKKRMSIIKSQRPTETIAEGKQKN